MRIKDFRTRSEDTITRIECNLVSPLSIKGSGKLEFITGNQFKLYGVVNGELKIINLEIVDSVKVKLLLQHMLKKEFNICYFETIGAKSTTLFLHIAFFYSVTREKICNVILSDKVKKSLVEKKMCREGENFENDIFRNFNLESELGDSFAFTNGFYDFDEIDRESEVKDEKLTLEDDTSEYDDPEYVESNLVKDKGIKIYGKEYNLCITIQHDSIGDYFYAEAVDYKKTNSSMSIWLGKLTFKDERAYISEKIKDEINSKPGYLGLWEEYSNMEGNILLDKARKIGQFTTSENVEYNSYMDEDGAEDRKLRRLKPIGLSPAAFDLLKEGDKLVISNDVPIYLKNLNMKWDEYQAYQQDLKEKRNKENIKTSDGQIESYEIIKKINDYFLIDDKNVGEVIRGMITYSIDGEAAQIDRRTKSRNLIMNANCEMPALGLLIEGKLPDENIKKTLQHHLEPITPFLKTKLFSKNDPTLVQRKAIDIALNTPDIAVIQGPPGTGKTTVIRAIIERLNEELDKNENNTGEVLVTSFQHAAVLNIRERLSVNSFPTPKFGTKDSINEEDSYKNIVHKWCDNYLSKLTEQNPELKENPKILEFNELHREYLNSPTQTNLNIFLEYAKKYNNKKEIYALIEELNNVELNRRSSDDFDLIPYIRRLRTTRESFLDDGSDTADALLDLLEPLLDAKVEANKKILHILDKAGAQMNREVSDELLKEISDVKKQLLKKCIPAPRYIISEPNNIVNQIYLDTIEQLKSPDTEINGAMFSLLNEFKNNSKRVFDLISKYNFVFSATCQQCDGKEIANAKKNYSAHPNSYDTVIIDEAARVNPGDLMIPIAKARNKIIFVGDHRQLPHIYDEELAETLIESSSSFEKEYIEKNIETSMFEYLLGKAKELSAKDGVQRVITLDYQFRMHPLLGEFINKNFYENHNVAESFKSPSGEMVKNYEQNLFSHPLCWFNIPNKNGNEEKRGTSRIRRSEVECIKDRLESYLIKEIKEDTVHLNMKEDTINEFLNGNTLEKYNIGLTYGVISFYSGQKKLLKDGLIELERKYQNEKTLEGKIIYEKLRRVKIGSVDEFQGMEFDVIFLSIVRSHNVIKNTNDEDNGKNGDKLFGIKNYGFLVSENRLCVALSRQKKLLVIVGDANMFVGNEWLEYSRKCVPAMVNLHSLCEKEGVIINV